LTRDPGLKTQDFNWRMELYDCHNHLQDERLKSQRGEIMAAVARESVTKMVVNGSCETDWADVLDLAKQYPNVIPSFGYHPWYVRERSSDWQSVLRQYLDRVPSAIGEIGLDRWIKDHDLPQQEEVFVWQLRLAAQRNLPVSIHCLQAWGRLLDLLRSEALPESGFLLHSYGGPQEMVQPLAELGAYFSLPGYFAHERKVRQRETFRHIPPERLLIETDAPDQLPPSDRIRHSLADPTTGSAIHHPANLVSVYDFAAELLGEPVKDLAERVRRNFHRLFGRLL
jgi:TatD DNase family protein